MFCIDSLCISQGNDELAITEKGISATESFMYSRYRMHIDVYWHKTVRGARKMVARAIDRYVWENSYDIEKRREKVKMIATHTTDRDFLEHLLSLFPRNSQGAKIVRHLVITRKSGGIRTIRPVRKLFKRVRTYTPLSKNEAGKIFASLTPGGPVFSESLLPLESAIAVQLSSIIETNIDSWEVIIDVPPSTEGKMEEVSVRLSESTSDIAYSDLSKMSAVAMEIKRDFINVNSKKIRIYCSPRVRNRLLCSETVIDKCITKAINKVVKG
ncbi:hypothetical protein ACFLV0_06210 [Chloroflexota bacterium]